MNLTDIAQKYYVQGYNCAESIIQAANEYYDLNMSQDEFKLISGFGGGMFVGSTCGALAASISCISKKEIATKAHDQLDTFRPHIQKCVRNFKDELGDTDCKNIKPIYHTKENKCIETIKHAAKALEKTMNELGYTPK